MSDRMILVQKFGGTSVSTPEGRRHVIEHVCRARHEGYDVAIVVSAMGRRGDPYATDTLLDLLRNGGDVDPRDYDLMFTCGEAISVAVMAQQLRREGIPARGLTSAQARIYTDGRNVEAEITEIDPVPLRAFLAAGEVPVIAGAQGVTRETLEVTTLGRGGSDTSGVAVGVALGASRVEIFTDVEGVFAVDPRVVPAAPILRQVSFPSMYEFARFGARVVHPRAILTGWQANLPIIVRSTFSQDRGTIIDGLGDAQSIVGVAALPPMETLVLQSTTIDDRCRVEWEKHHVAMSIIDNVTENLFVGIAASQAGELDTIVREAGARIVQRLGLCCWASVIGRRGLLSRHLGGEDIAAVEEEGTRVCACETSERRRTYIVAGAEIAAIVPTLYAAASGLSAEGAESTPARLST
jgi:aspartate kinase